MKVIAKMKLRAWEKIIEKILSLIGIFIIFIGILAVYNGYKIYGIEGILWFSYFAFFLIGVGILIRSSFLIASQINVLLFPYIFWNIDFFYRLLTSKSFLGLTNYFFESRPFILQLITFQHLILIPIAFLALFFIKIKRNDFWKFSIIEIIVFFFLIRAIGSEEANINCVFRNCLPFTIAYYPVVWFLINFLVIFITNLFLVRIGWFIEGKMDKKRKLFDKKFNKRKQSFWV